MTNLTFIGLILAVISVCSSSFSLGVTLQKNNDNKVIKDLQTQLQDAKDESASFQTMYSNLMEFDTTHPCKRQ